jgi:hypothetical protein
LHCATLSDSAGTSSSIYLSSEALRYCISPV